MNPIFSARYLVLSRSVMSVRSLPRMSTCPSVRSSRPDMQLSRVVLPHPEGPMTATISPSLTDRSTPLKASTLTFPES